MKIFVKRISYDDYLAAYAEGGGLAKLYAATKRELPEPKTAKEWVEEQGSLEGPILRALKVVTTKEAEKMKVSEEGGYLITDNDIATPEGMVAISESDYAKQVKRQKGE